MPLDKYQHDNGYWYIRGTVTVWRDGKPTAVAIHRSTRTRNEDEAEGVRRQVENEAVERNITNREPAITFEQAARRYIAHGGEERFTVKPIAHLGRLRVDQISQQQIDDAALKAYPVAAPSTRRRQFHTPVASVLKSAGIHTPVKRPPEGQKRTIFFRPDSAAAMLAAVVQSRYPNPWTPAFVTFLFAQGSRVSETLAIDGRDDISLSGRYAILRDTKSGKERMVPLYRRTIAALSTVPNIGKRGPLFLRYDGRPYEERNGNGYQFTFWSRAVRAVGLSPNVYTPHTARHSWATWFYAQTKDVVRLKSEGGWDSDEWQRYVKLAAPSLAFEAIRHGFDFRENAPGTESVEESADFSQKRGAV